MIPRNNHSLLRCSEYDQWTWDEKQKSCDAHFLDHSCRSVIFHPTWSTGTSAVRGTKILNNSRSFWEIAMTGGLGGTSLMLGIGTKQATLGAHTFCNIIGKDKHSWGLSHRGFLWHSGISEKYCSPFKEYETPVIGLLFDGIEGTLTYFKDGVNCGLAFRNLDMIEEPLFPMISATSNKSIMTLQKTECEFVSLQDRCKATMLRTWKINIIEKFPMPISIRKYLNEGNDDDKRCQDCFWYVPRF